MNNQEQNHRKLLARHQTLINSIYEGLLYETQDRKVLLANQAFCRMFNIPSPEALIGADCREAAEAAKNLFTNPERFLTTTEQCLTENRTVLKEEFELIDGRFFERDYIPVQVDGEEQGHYWIYRDITARKMQEERISHYEELQRLLFFLASEFINIPAGQVDNIFNHALAEIGKFVQVERTYIFYFDFTKGTMSNTHEWCAENIVSHIAEMQSVSIAEYTNSEQLACLRRGEPFYVSDVDSLSETDPLHGILKDQNTKSMLNVPMIAEDECIGFVGFDAVWQKRVWGKQEISLLAILANLLTHTEMRRQAEQEQKRVNEQMQQNQRLESLGVLAGGIAHDFNNIMMAILGNAELAIEEIGDNPNAKAKINTILQSGQNAVDLCRQMLAYAGKSNVVKGKTNIGCLIEDMNDLLQTSVSAKSKLILDIAPSLPSVWADPSQIRQIIMNLIINASEAIDKPEGVITVSVGADHYSREYLQRNELHDELTPGEYLYLEISDNGHGIELAERARIFEPFFTTKFVGRGLGLSAVMGIVREHHGALRLYSEPNRGTTFKILLPALPSEQEKKTATLKEGDGIGHQSGAEKVATVLLAEDDEDVRRLAKIMLNRFGCQVFTAVNGREAVECFRQSSKKIDLVILDLTMPIMDGRQAFTEISKINPEIKAVIASGYSENHISANFIEEGNVRILEKPYSPSQLKAILKQLVPALTF